MDHPTAPSPSAPQTRHTATDATSRPAILRGPDRPDLLREETLSSILAATAQRAPQHPALIWGDRIITYAQLHTASDTIGHALAQHGAKTGSVIGLFLPRGADLLIAQAGITKSAAAWLPFDAEAPLERLAFCLQSAKAIGLVTSREWLPRLKNLSIPIWPIEDLLTENQHPIQARSVLPLLPKGGEGRGEEAFARTRKPLSPSPRGRGPG